MSIFGPRTFKNRVVAFCVGIPLVLAVPVMICLMHSEPAKDLTEKCIRTVLIELFFIIFTLGVLAVVWSFGHGDRVDRMIAQLRGRLAVIYALLLGLPLVIGCLGRFWN